MAEEAKETNWTEHVANGEAWLRFLLMILFAPVLGCVGFLVLCIALFQFFAVLASGESNPQLREMGRDLSRFGVGIVDFLTYNTERRPFAFHPPPAEREPGVASPQGSRASGPSATPASRRKRTTRKRVPRKKKATRRKKTTERRKATSPSAKTGTPAEQGASSAPENEEGFEPKADSASSDRSRGET